MSGAAPTEHVRHPQDVPDISDSALLDCLQVLTQLHGQPISHTALLAGVPLENSGMFTPGDFIRAAQHHGYAARVSRRRLGRISELLLPAVLLLNDGGACILQRRLQSDSYEVIVPESGTGTRTIEASELSQMYSGYVIACQAQMSERMADNAGPRRRRSWFWGSFAAYSPYYLEAAIAGILVNVLTVATALFIMNVYDRVVPNNAFETLIALTLGTAAAILFEFCARSLRAFFLDSAGRKVDLDLAAQIFAQAIGLKLSSRPASAGAFAAQLREFESVREFITSVTLTTLMDLPFVAFFIAIVAAIGGPLFWVPLVAVPVVLLAGLLAQIPLAIIMRAHLKEIAMRHGLLVESIENVESVKAMRAEGQLQRRYEHYSALAGHSATRARMISSLVVHFSAMVQQLVVVAMVFWGVHLIAIGELTVGALVACVILIGRGLAPLQQIAGLMMRYQQARAAHHNLNSLMAHTREREPGQAFTHHAPVAGAISMKAVDFAYPGTQVNSLRSASFEIAAGEHVAILGRVGSGKSTLLRLAMGLYEPDDGVVCVDGIDSKQFDPADLRRQMGYVAQEPALIQGSLRDNIALGRPQASDAEVLAAARIAGLESMINNHPEGLQRAIGERGQGLSGGQQQAVAIARAVLLEPQILLLDEPTSAMDHTSESRFVQALNQFAASRSLLLVTHKPSMLGLVSRIIVLDNGQIVMDGPRDEILRTLTHNATAAVEK